MTLNTLQPYIDSSVATKTAESVLDRVFYEIKKLSNASEYSEQWIEDSLSIIRFSKDIENGFAHSQATMIAVFKTAWDNLPLNFRKQYGNQFLLFAQCVSGGKAVSSINNRIATANLWIIGEYGKGKVVSIKQRTPEGKPIFEDGRELRKDVEFCPYIVDISKLEILNPRAKNNDMTDVLWEMLVDPFFTCDDIRAEHHKKDEKEVYQYTLRYDLSGPALMAYQNGNGVVVAPELNWEEYDTDPLVKEAIDNLLRIFNVQMDEDKIFKMVREMYK